MVDDYKGPERRKFIRLEYIKPLAYKVCREETISKLLNGYTTNLSQMGVCCRIEEEVHQDDILWLSFDKATLHLCEDFERNVVIYQGGFIGRVVRVDSKQDGVYDVGVRFITKEENGSKNITAQFPEKNE